MIKIKVNQKSLNDLKKDIVKFQDKLKMVEKRFLIESAEWIIARANSNLETRTTFKDTTDIQNGWEYEFVADNYLCLKNKADFAAFAEFGTGSVGQRMPHEKASEVGYKYDVNAHGSKGWTFVRDLTNKSMVVNAIYPTREIGNGRYILFRNFKGYEGKSYFYDAILDYQIEQQYIKIYSRIFDEYMK